MGRKRPTETQQQPKALNTMAVFPAYIAVKTLDERRSLDKERGALRQLLRQQGLSDESILTSVKEVDPMTFMIAAYDADIKDIMEKALG